MKRALAILTPFLIAWCPQAFPQYAQKIPENVYKCVEDGKAVYQDGPCAASMRTKPLKTRDAKGIEAPKRAAAEYVPPGPAPVAVIPYTPSKPIGTTGVSKNPTSCRSATYGASASC